MTTETNTLSHDYRCGFIALVGRPNVGKSTLMNQLIGQKISIVTHKAQTTRHRVNGILTTDAAQLIFVDTPGIHSSEGRQLNRQMNQAATEALRAADVILVMVMANQWNKHDQRVLDLALQAGRPVFLVINKVDTVQHREKLLPWLAEHANHAGLNGVYLISARSGDGCDKLMDGVIGQLPAMPAMYPHDQLSDKSQRFLVAELIREQLLQRMHKELPYGMHVVIDQFDESQKQILINATIWVAKNSHKGMLIGKQGSQLKQIGTAARKAIQEFLGRPVHLELWASVQEDWYNKPGQLQQLGITD